ncbi:MAG: DUF29 domain-containing protein [Caulobacteraceae bacterium]
MSAVYDTDFHAWAHEQADAVRRRSVNEIDWDNIAEELESLGKSQASQLHSRYVVLLSHLLKWVYQSGFAGASWEATIREQCRAIERLIRQNPSLKSLEAEVFSDAYTDACLRALGETGLPKGTFPAESPFTIEQANDSEFWPDAVDENS